MPSEKEKKFIKLVNECIALRIKLKKQLEKIENDSIELDELIENLNIENTEAKKRARQILNKHRKKTRRAPRTPAKKKKKASILSFFGNLFG